MSRLITAGAELADASGNADGLTVGIFGILPTIESTIVRTGAKSYKFSPPASTGASLARRDSSGVTFSRQYNRFPSWPSGTCAVYLITGIDSSSYGDVFTTVLEVRISSSGVVQLVAVVGGVLTARGSSFQLALDTWHRIEVGFNSGGTCELRVDGVSGGSASMDNTGSRYVTFSRDVGYFGPDQAGVPSGATTYCDDIALNEDSGADQNSWCGPGDIRVQPAVSDNARSAGWTTGNGGTTNLQNAVKTVPPGGLALASATNTSQIKNVALTTTDNYDANVTDYLTAGIGSTDTITLVQAIANVANSSSTVRSAAVKAVSNPSDSGEASLSMSGPGGIYPVNWQWLAGNIVYSPSVTKGTSPVVRVGKRTSSTDAAMCDFLGLIVESTPAVATTPLPPRLHNERAVHRASVR